MSNLLVARAVGAALLLAGSLASAGSPSHVPSGRALLLRGEFGGNGRTCGTCHSLRTGDITLERIRERFAEDPDDPLFRPLDSDDGAGGSYDRLLSHATFRVFVNLPPNVRLADDPAATRVALFRST